MIYDIQTPTWILHTSSLQVKNGLILIFCLFHKTNRRGRLWSKNRTDAKRCREISAERIDLFLTFDGDKGRTFIIENEDVREILTDGCSAETILRSAHRHRCINS